jgi:hypothetical protein
MLASLPAVRERRLTVSLRYDRSDPAYHLAGDDPDR